MNTIVVNYDTAQEMYNKTKFGDAMELVENMAFDEFTVAFRTKGGFIRPIVKANLFKGTYSFMFVPLQSDLYQGDSEEHYMWYEDGKIKIGNQSGVIESDMIKCMAWIVVMVCNRAMNYQRDRKEVHSIPRKYSREHRLSTSKNKIYLLDDIIKYVHDNYVSQGGHHEIKCPSWEVRGHYRHYKSGKVVFIPSYKKGKERDKTSPKDKEYYL